MKIVVIGGTRLIATKLVNNLRQRGHEVLAASLESGINTFTAEGLADALRRSSGRRCRERAAVGRQGRAGVF